MSNKTKLSEIKLLVEDSYDNVNGDHIDFLIEQIEKSWAKEDKYKEVLLDAKETFIAMYSGDTEWTLEQERFGNKAIGLMSIKKINDVLKPKGI